MAFLRATALAALLFACGALAAEAPKKPSPDDVPVCPDVPPDDKYTCVEQMEFEKCGQKFMEGYCLSTCGPCPFCSDISYDDVTCEVHASEGRCDDDKMDGGLFCQASCNRCLVLPPQGPMTVVSDDGKTRTEVTKGDNAVAGAQAMGDVRFTQTTVSEDGSSSSAKSVSVSSSGRRRREL